MFIEEYINSFKKHSFYKLNTKNKIKRTLCIPENVDLSKLALEVDKCYSNYYIRKTHKKHSRKERHLLYITQDEYKEERFYQKPLDFDKKKYRYITAVNTKSWLKGSLKKLNKIFTKSLYDEENKPIIPFVHSSYKKRSYKTNAEELLNFDYIVTIDMSNFFPSISREKVYSFLKGYLKFDSDISKILSILCTSLNGVDSENKYNLGQGLSTSTTLALLLNLTLFEHLYREAQEKGISMCVYVDDIAFGSNNKIGQDFIDTLFGLIKYNGMCINKKKFRSYNYGSVRKITGTYLKNGKMSIAYSKKEEIEYQYRYLIEYLNVISCIEQYLEYFVVLQRFTGNINYMKYVEGSVPNKYEKQINKVSNKFPRVLHRINKNEVYSLDNLMEEDKKELYKKFNTLKDINV